MDSVLIQGGIRGIVMSDRESTVDFFAMPSPRFHVCVGIAPFALPFWVPKSVFWGIFRGFCLKNGSFVRIRPERLACDVLNRMVDVRRKKKHLLCPGRHGRFSPE